MITTITITAPASAIAASEPSSLRIRPNITASSSRSAPHVIDVPTPTFNVRPEREVLRPEVFPKMELFVPLERRTFPKRPMPVKWDDGLTLS